MTAEIGIGFYLMLGVLGSLGVTAGYLLGLRRFESRSRAELEAVERQWEEEQTAAIERAREDERAATERAIAEVQQRAQEELEAAARVRDGDRTTAERAIAEIEHKAKAEREAAAKVRDSERTTAQRAIAEAEQKAEQKVQAAQRKPIPMLTHTVLLDGVSKSGKSTLVHRFAFPCAEQQSLEKITATQVAYRTRVLPICFVPAYVADGSPPPLLHAQILRDIAGEKPNDVVDIVTELAAERGQPGGERGPATVICVLVWDMADTISTRARITKERLQLAYHNKSARSLIKHFIFFFNKIDLLEVAPERLRQLIADERAYIESITNFFDSDVKRTYISGSALRGDGVIECQGAIYAALGLAEQFRVVAEKEGKVA